MLHVFFKETLIMNYEHETRLKKNIDADRNSKGPFETLGHVGDAKRGDTGSL